MKFSQLFYTKTLTSSNVNYELCFQRGLMTKSDTLNLEIILKTKVENDISMAYCTRHYYLNKVKMLPFRWAGGGNKATLIYRFVWRVAEKKIPSKGPPKKKNTFGQIKPPKKIFFAFFL